MSSASHPRQDNYGTEHRWRRCKGNHPRNLLGYLESKLQLLVFEILRKSLTRIARNAGAAARECGEDLRRGINGEEQELHQGIVGNDSFYLKLSDEKLRHVHEHNFDHPELQSDLIQMAVSFKYWDECLNPQDLEALWETLK
ncbi:hypothetical protein Sjap_017811 [Stephania japonica]|uniref:Uncharacterized protein n=1 Tax=Stephania japonica TaxID=461633 RepID=A0AAP0NMG1_9MAGN